MKIYLAYDNKDFRLYDNPTICGSITTRIGVTGCSCKIIEFDLNRIKIKYEQNKNKTGN